MGSRSQNRMFCHSRAFSISFRCILILIHSCSFSFINNLHTSSITIRASLILTFIFSLEQSTRVTREVIQTPLHYCVRIFTVVLSCTGTFIIIFSDDITIVYQSEDPIPASHQLQLHLVHIKYVIFEMEDWWYQAAVSTNTNKSHFDLRSKEFSSASIYNYPIPNSVLRLCSR